MKKVAILLGLGAFLAVSCGNKTPEPHVSNVNFTPCQQTKVKSAEFADRVDVEFTNEGIQITYYDFEVTCDFTAVNVNHTLVNGVLNITQEGYPNKADCVCYTDVSYTINGISQEEVNVVFINGVQVYCYNGKEVEPNLQGTKWKLAGIVETETGDLKVLEPKDCVECYTLSFDTKSTFSGRTASNVIAWANYEINYITGSFRITDIIGTEMGEVGDGYLYFENLLEIQYFAIKDTHPIELHFFFNDGKNYLLFKQLTP